MSDPDLSKEKLNEYSLDVLERYAEWLFSRAVTVEEIKKILRVAPERSRIKSRARRKLIRLSTVKIETASTVDEAKNAFSVVPCGRASYQKLRIQALQKWISLCRTAKEAKETYEAALRGLNTSGAIARWRELSAQEIEAASTLEEVIDAFKDAPGCTDRILNILERCQTVAKAKKVWCKIRPETPGADERVDTLLLEFVFEVKEARNLCQNGRQSIQDRMFKRWLELVRKAIKCATTPEEAYTAWNNSLDAWGYPAREELTLAALKKLDALLVAEKRVSVS